MIKALEQWYSKHCDGDWEHNYGVKIDTLDNPGWCVSIDLTGTELEKKCFSEIKVERSGNDWYHCSVNENIFIGRCGPSNLTETLNIFLTWAS
jgi:hypothetical protein